LFVLLLGFPLVGCEGSSGLAGFYGASLRQLGGSIIVFVFCC
jgi:hypothetical protein